METVFRHEAYEIRRDSGHYFLYFAGAFLYELAVYEIGTLITELTGN